VNILFTSPTYHPHRGGAETSIEDLADRFVQRGHQVSILTGRSSRSLPAFERRRGARLYRLAYPPQTVRSTRDAVMLLSRGTALLLRILRLFRRQRFDTVCIGLLGVEALFIALLIPLVPMKLVVYIHGDEIRTYVRISRVMRWALRRCLRRCHAVIAVSRELEQETLEFASYVRGKIFVIPNAIDWDAVRRAPAHDRSRPYALYAGRLAQGKGLDTLLDAFRTVSVRVPGLDLLIVGEGPAATELERLTAKFEIGERVVFLGRQEREAVYSLLRGCEFLVLPSRAEGCPLILLEAMAAGKMTIASRVKGVTSIIEEHGAGILFDPGDAAALARQMIRYASDPLLRAPLEAAIREQKPGPFDLDKTFQSHLEVYALSPPEPAAASRVDDTLRIGLVSPFFYEDEHCSGLSAYHFNLHKALSELGHVVHLITAADGTWRPGNVSQIAARLRFSFHAYRKLRALARSDGLDVVEAPELFAPGLLVALLMPGKLVTRIHTPTYIGDRYNQRYPWDWIGKLVGLPERVQARRSVGISVASHRLASVIARDWGISPDRMDVIPNGIAVDWVSALGEAQPKSLPGDYLLYFGRLERRKGVHTISRALSRVLRERSELRMVFIGKDCGLKRQILRENAAYSTRLLFQDTLGKAALFGAIRHARLVLLPSLFENLPYAALETMALGRPLVGTFGTTFEELIEDGVEGFLVQPGDAGALAAKILECLERDDLDEIGRRARARVQALDARAVAARCVECYRKRSSAQGKRTRRLPRLRKRVRASR
jgi:glycogen(starch) synthase